ARPPPGLEPGALGRTPPPAESERRRVLSGPADPFATPVPARDAPVSRAALDRRRNRDDRSRPVPRCLDGSRVGRGGDLRLLRRRGLGGLLSPHPPRDGVD